MRAWLENKIIRIVLFTALAARITAALFAGTAPVQDRPASGPEHVILIIVDGLSYKVWDKMELPALRKLASGGFLAEKVYLPPAAHPREGPYARLHTCSIPNPVMMSGSVFIDENTLYLSSAFFPKMVTAFAANTVSYETLTRGYNFVYQKEVNDGEAAAMALEFMEEGKPAFTRLHLQDLGEAGSSVAAGRGNPVWAYDIWHPESPYRRKLIEADELISGFLKGLERLGVLERTAMVILGDHGQADSGWHPLEYMDPSITTMVLWGAGIKKGDRTPYAELIDVVPTICELMGVPAPATSQGRVLFEALEGCEARVSPRPEIQKTMNGQFIEYRKITASISLLLEEMPVSLQWRFFRRYNSFKQSFYDIHRFTEWPRFKTREELMAQNARALSGLNELLDSARKEAGRN
ncbi:MAG TPA: sulfatase-like hydrolase/transferase [Candidatus Aminicenantes bacterium]|nr:sulfatase-like hydrolase/transferase [Candidatus Aminicenantes bacterium]